MKGVIARCLGQLVIENFGQDKWDAILEGAGFDKSAKFLPISDIDDKKIFELIGSSCKVLKISQQQAFDAFGEYWSAVYAPKNYGAYYASAKNAKDFILKMDSVHVATTKNMPNAHPPRFNFKWDNDKTLIVTYLSQRGLIDLLVSLTKGVGKYFKEELSVSRLDATRMKIVFTY